MACQKLAQHNIGTLIIVFSQGIPQLNNISWNSCLNLSYKISSTLAIAKTDNHNLSKLPRTHTYPRFKVKTAHI